MARKVFISVLGTGNYQECTYTKDGFELRTRFIQQATLEYHKHLGVEWDENSAVYILLTQEAKDRNWEVCKDFKGNVTNEQGLHKVLDDMHLKAHIHDVDIDDGKDDKELWGIFDTVFNLIKDGDELYFDLTHGFRYLPMLVLVLGNYVKYLKKAEVKAITYGNYEMSERGTKHGPIFDLLPLSALQDWTFAAANFVKNGDVTKLTELCGNVLTPILSDPTKRDVETMNLRKYIDRLSDLVTQMKFCRGIDIYKSTAIRSIRQNHISESTFLKPFNPLLKEINLSIKDFSTDKSAINLITAARWCFDRGQYQAAVTLLEEGIVTYFCDRHNIQYNNHDKREIINHAFMKLYIQYHPSEGPYRQMRKEEDERKVESVAADELIMNKELVDIFHSLSDLRNDFNHAGMNGSPRKPINKNKNKDGNKGNNKDMKTNIDEFISLARQHLPMKKKPRLFLNLSNHPSSEWGEEQRKAAEQYGDIEDMPFPQVDPDADEKKIEELAERITEEILKKAEAHDITVHIMGEMCLTFAVVSRLTTHGIRCVSSTTERIVEQLPDGSKRTKFHFWRFREYEC